MSKYTKDDIIRMVEEEGIDFIRMQFTDIFGQAKNVAITASQIQKAVNNQISIDGSSIEGFTRIHESDQYLYPDLDTFTVLSWYEQQGKVARLLCDVCNPDGTPFIGDPRGALKRVLRRAADLGYTFNVGPECEFFLFEMDKDGKPTTKTNDEAGYFDLGPIDHGDHTRREICLALEALGFEIEASHHEVAAGQHEIDLRYADALSMADAVMTYKQVVKEIAMKHGVYASFMPKPMADAPGNGMHVHQSLMDRSGNNVFFDPDDPSGYNLSATAKSYIAGLLKYAPEYTLVTNQYVNSYKRLQPGGEAPTCISWGARNRSTLVRIPGYRPNSESACRVELRSPDPAANPYLAFAVMLAAGLAGIEEGLELMPPADEAAPIGCTRYEHRARGIETLPESLGEAVERFAESKLMRETLGEHIHDYLVRTKREEWEAYQGIVTAWELERNLAVL